MKEFAIPPKHLMLALLLSLLAGCGGGSDPVVPKALTEHDFAADPSLRLEAGSVGVTFLEPKDAAPATSGDTGLTGTDEFPLRIAEQTTFTYAIDPADNTIAMVKLIRLTGNQEVFVINATQPRATVTLEPGAYKLVVYSGYMVAEANGETHRAVFLQDNTSRPAPAQAAINASVPRKSALATATPTSILLSTKMCIGCDLTSANLYGAKLTNANLTNADLTWAYLRGANLVNANLVNANLANANLTYADLTKTNLTKANLANAILANAFLPNTNLTNANLYKVDLTGANLDRANLDSANLTNANLTNAFLYGANLTNANLTNANLTNADLYKVDLTGAIWTDGRICAANSISSCK